jgi:hypothetical protein
MSTQTLRNVLQGFTAFLEGHNLVAIDSIRSLFCHTYAFQSSAAEEEEEDIRDVIAQFRDKSLNSTSSLTGYFGDWRNKEKITNFLLRAINVCTKEWMEAGSYIRGYGDTGY